MHRSISIYHLQGVPTYADIAVNLMRVLNNVIEQITLELGVSGSLSDTAPEGGEVGLSDIFNMCFLFKSEIS